MMIHMFSLMGCKTVGDKSYILADTNYECYTNDHYLAIIMISIPGIVIWGILIPSIIFTYVRKTIK